MTEAEWAEALVQTYARSLAIGFCVIDPIRIAVMLAVSPLAQRFVLFVATGRLLILLFLVLLLIAVTAVINFTNFMDGLDGLVAGCMAVTIGSLSLELNASWSLWALLRMART